MSITDELREWAVNHRAELDMGQLYPAMIHDIADRIDAEHKKACDDAWDNGYEADYLGIEKWLTEHPQVMEHHGWIRLPKDADGEYIHFGDMLDQFGTPMTVFAMSDPDPDQGDCMLELITDGISDSTWVRARKMRHHHAPTVEDVLREMLDAWGELPSNATNEAIIAEYAAKLKLADGEDA